MAGISTSGTADPARDAGHIVQVLVETLQQTGSRALHERRSSGGEALKRVCQAHPHIGVAKGDEAPQCAGIGRVITAAKPVDLGDCSIAENLQGTAYRRPTLHLRHARHRALADSGEHLDGLDQGVNPRAGREFLLHSSKPPVEFAGQPGCGGIRDACHQGSRFRVRAGTPSAQHAFRGLGDGYAEGADMGEAGTCRRVVVHRPFCAHCLGAADAGHLGGDTVGDAGDPATLQEHLAAGIQCL